jgi:hypothetical protein
VNIFEDNDLQLANEFHRALKLGANSKDLKEMYPVYFGVSDAGSTAKAQRIAADLRPDNLRMKRRRVPNIHGFMDKKKNRLVANNFSKLFFAKILEDEELGVTAQKLLDAYETWLSVYEEDKNDPILSFQAARVFAGHVSFQINLRGSKQVFTICKECNSHHLVFKNENHRQYRCPYCQTSKSKEALIENQN